MEITWSEVYNRYIQMEDAQKIRFLTVLLRELTVSARVYYPAVVTNDDVRTKAFVVFNELAHRITNQLYSYIFSVKPYSDEVFLQIIRDTIKNTEVVGDVGWAFEKAMANGEFAFYISRNGKGKE